VTARVRGALLWGILATALEGIAFGFISYSLLKLISGRGRDVHGLVYLFALLFIIR